MEIINEGKFQRLSATHDISTESQTDYILPDYQGDVRRILFTECKLARSGKYSDETGDEFSGILTYEVVYLDSEGKLTRASFTSDYDLRLKATDDERKAAFAEPRVTSCTIRLTGPRRISAKATVSATVECVCEDEIYATGSAFENEAELQALEQVISLRSVCECESAEREYAERLERLDGAIADEVEILYSGAEVNVGRIAAEGGSVVISGELELFALLSVEGSPIYLAEKILPFEESIPFEGASDGMHLIPRAEVRSSVCAINADDSGCEVAASCIIALGAFAEYNNQVKVTADAYSTAADCECTYKDYRYTTLTDCHTFSDSFTCEPTLDLISSEKLREIPYLSATLKVDSVEIKDGEASIVGELRTVGVATIIDEAGAISYSALKFSVPYEKKIKCSAQDGAKLQCRIDCGRVRAMVDTATARLTYQLSGSLLASEQASIRLLQSADALPKEEAEPGRSITVYYPTDGDTLFAVAKKFRTPMLKLAADNGLSAQASANGELSLKGTPRLLIY